jgi:hypothetical protein
MLKLPLSKKSFGLVELIVALAIVVVILTLSTVGINSLRDSFQLNSGTQELFNAISLARVYAENNVTYKDIDGNIKVPDAYMIEVGNYTTIPGNISEIEGFINNVQIKYCNLNPLKKDFEDQLVDGINVKCEMYQKKGIENDLVGVEILKEEYIDNNKTIYEPCSYILFTVQNNELYISSGPAEGLLKTSPCVITIKGVNSGTKNRIAINPVNRTIKKL